MNGKSLNLTTSNWANLMRTTKGMSHLRRVRLLLAQVSNFWSFTLVDLTLRTVTVNMVAIQHKATVTFLFNIASYVAIG